MVLRNKDSLEQLSVKPFSRYLLLLDDMVIIIVIVIVIVVKA